MANGSKASNGENGSQNKPKKFRVPQPQKRNSRSWTKDNPPPTKFKSKKELGGAIDPRINIGGRPKLVSEAYKAWLEAVDANGVSNAAKIANAIGHKAIADEDHQAAKEIRQATEGDLIRGLADAELDARIKEIEARIVTGSAGEGAEDSTAAEPTEGAEPS